VDGLHCIWGPISRTLGRAQHNAWNNNFQHFRWPYTHQPPSSFKAFKGDRNINRQ
jgi:hypothetical protein